MRKEGEREGAPRKGSSPNGFGDPPTAGILGWRRRWMPLQLAGVRRPSSSRALSVGSDRTVVALR